MGHRTVHVPERLIRAGVVLANCQTTQRGVACYVPDDEQGQYEGVCKLLEQGYRRPLCIHLPEGATGTSLRRKGLRRAFREFNIAEKDQTHVVLVNKPDQLQSVQFLNEADFLQTVPFLSEAFAKRPRPDCVICGNDRVALVAYQHLLSRGLRIPNDIGVLGFDDLVGIAGLFLPPLSTIRLPHDEIGRAAALHIIEGQKEPGIHRIACPFVGRASF
jgi:DNA-binding LacI/PurR family transcriptional regulator